MNLLTIIREEIQMLLDGYAEGVGDKYADKKWDIPDADKKYLSQTQAAVQNKDMGELVGYTRLAYSAGVKSRTPIYKNPKSLKGFGPNVRAVSDRDGNLFVAQFDNDFVHGGMQLVSKFDVYEIKENITWNRSGTTNKFGFSDSMEQKFEYETDVITKQNVFRRVETLKQKHPAFEFVPYFV